MNVGCVSDVSLGYGSPQITLMVRSLSRYADDGQRAVITEVDQPDRPPRHAHFPDLDIVRVPTSRHPHREPLGRTEYVMRAARVLNERRPEILLLPNTLCLPVLWELKYKPRLVIYHVLEMPCTFGFDPEEHGLNVAARDKIDLVIYPERNRAKSHIDTYGYHKIPHVLVYNVSLTETGECVPGRDRNGRIIYQGVIDPDRTGGNLYLDPRVQQYPVDLYGGLDGTPTAFRAKIRRGLGRIRHCGLVDAATLQNARRSYSYGFIYWNPDNLNQLYACPNKFFESIASGVPPITAPHPQTEMLTTRYRCGIVMKDWSVEAFLRAAEQAMDLVGTPEYQRMVDNCRVAHVRELNWETQFNKVEWQLAQMGWSARRPSDSRLVAKDPGGQHRRDALVPAPERSGKITA